jgi:hypothetical protein
MIPVEAGSFCGGEKICRGNERGQDDRNAFMLGFSFGNRAKWLHIDQFHHLSTTSSQDPMARVDKKEYDLCGLRETASQLSEIAHLSRLPVCCVP